MGDILILAWLREWRNIKSVFRLDSETTSDEIKGTRRLPQGDPVGPTLFNFIWDTLTIRFARIARGNGGGRQLLDGTCVNFVLFADNYWLVATSAEMFYIMT